MFGDVDIWYDDYCEECKNRGETPKSMDDWWNGEE